MLRFRVALLQVPVPAQVRLLPEPVRVSVRRVQALVRQRRVLAVAPAARFWASPADVASAWAGPVSQNAVPVRL